MKVAKVKAQPDRIEGDAWVVLRMPARMTLYWLDLVTLLPWLDGWTPIKIVKVDKRDERKPLLPGIGFVPLLMLRRASLDAQMAGILGVEPSFFNDSMMIVGDNGLEGLREIEKLINDGGEIAEEPAVKLRIGMNVEINGSWFEGKCGLIKRLDAENAQIDVPGLAGRLTVNRRLLTPI